MNKPATDATQPLSRKLLISILLCMSVFALLATAVQIYFDYRSEIERIEQRLEGIESSHAQSIGSSLWLVDREQVELQLKGILEMQDVEYIKIDVVDDADYEVGTIPPLKDIKQEVFNLTHQAQGQTQNLGRLTVMASTQDLNNRMRKHAVSILFTQLLKILLVSAAILGMFKYLVTRHLVTMAAYVRGFGIDSLDHELKLDRRVTLSNQDDELSHVVNAINDMRGQLSEDIHRREAIERALIQSKEKLETLYNKNPSMYFTAGVDGTLVSVNDFGAQQLGYDPFELVGKSINILYANGIKDSVVRSVDLSTADEEKLYRRDVCLVHKTGREIWVREVARVIKNEINEKQILVISEDFTEARELSEKLDFQAAHDSLTQLVNRNEFERLLTERIEALHQVSAKNHSALLYLDLDQFKIVNDTCGHIAGDELLKQVSSLLRERMRVGDTLARLGGDEFGILLENCSENHAIMLAEGLCEAISDFEFTWGAGKFKLSTSIGLVVIDGILDSCSVALSRADNACYVAKDLGRNRIHVYNKDDAELSKRVTQMQWVTRIESALEQDRFELFFQSIIPIDSNETDLNHYEILLRMRSEDGKALISPGEFLPAAEQYNLMLKIDQLVVKKSFHFLKDNPDLLASISSCSINLSGQTLMESSFIDFVSEAFNDTTIPPEKICFEITETAAIEDLSMASKFIASLRKKGCKFSLDDFGSGLSSFAYLKSLAVDFVKIDGLFVKDIMTDPIDFAMVRSINEVAQIMGKQTVAEFVEDEATMEALRQIGIDFAQGYHVGRPEPVESFLMPSKHNSNG